MIFVTADSDRTRLEELSRLLVSVFPGSAIYQHTDPCRAPGDAVNHRVSAVFLEADMAEISGVEIMQMIHGQKKEVPVYILSATEDSGAAAVEAGARGYLLRPLSGERLKEALRPLCAGGEAFG